MIVSIVGVELHLAVAGIPVQIRHVRPLTVVGNEEAFLSFQLLAAGAPTPDILYETSVAKSELSQDKNTECSTKSRCTLLSREAGQDSGSVMRGELDFGAERWKTPVHEPTFLIVILKQQKRTWKTKD